MIPTIGKEEFNQAITNPLKITIVLFTTEWNSACQIVSIILEDLAERHKDQIGLFAVSQENEKPLLAEFGITEFPTILFFRNGKIIDHAKGLLPKNQLGQKINDALKA